MSEQEPIRAQPKSVPEGYRTWNEYWTKQRNQPWRTEIEIDDERQQSLTTRRGVQPNIETGLYPFRDENGSIRLTRADVEWLLVTHESGGMHGPVDWSDEKQRHRDGLDLRGADLRGENLNGLPLARLRGGLTQKEYDDNSTASQRDWAGINLEAAHLRNAHLEEASLTRAHLENAELDHSHLEGAFLRRAYLQRAQLRGAFLSGANLRGAHFERAYLREAHLEGTKLPISEGASAQKRSRHIQSQTLSPANLQQAFFDVGTVLDDIALGNADLGWVRVADTHWHGANLAVIDWSSIRYLGEESEARQERLRLRSRKDRNILAQQYESAARANQQLAIELRSQGINEHGNRFAYRAQICQRIALRMKSRYLRYLGSLSLDLISGYGYKPMRCVYTYVAVILGFAAAYFVATNFAIFPLLPSQSSPLLWYEALVLSLSSFHGRGLLPRDLSLGDPIAILAAGEAVIGLLIEITFIATFTRRFFAH